MNHKQSLRSLALVNSTLSSDFVESEDSAQTRTHMNQNIPQGSEGKVIKLEYKLPAVVEALQEGWRTTINSAAVVSALLTGVAASLLGFFKDYNKAFNKTPHDSLGISAVLTLCYSALLLNASATFTALILTDVLSELAVRSARDRNLRDEKPDYILLESASSAALLERYKAGKAWNWVMWHWFISLMAGIVCTIGQVLVYIWLEERLFIKILTTIFVSFAALPFSLFVLPVAIGRP